MSAWTRVSRAIVMVIGIGALLTAGGNLVTGGGSISDPVMPGGVVLGLLLIGAAAWTDAADAPRAGVVWLGLLGIAAALAIAWANLGDMQTRDLLLYVGFPTVIVALAVAGVAVGRVRAGTLGR